MSLKVGITGGIGSGKSIVAQVFALLHVPVLNADSIAKHLMDTDEQLKIAISSLLGTEAYKLGKLDRAFVASVVFNQPEKLAALNQLVHPVTIQYSEQWAQQQAAPYVLKEAAIFFESGSYKEMDKMIGVYAPKEMRLARAMKRDNTSEAEILRRLDKQMNEEEKMKRCDFVINNDGTKSVIQQVLDLHNELLQLAAHTTK